MKLGRNNIKSILTKTIPDVMLYRTARQERLSWSNSYEKYGTVPESDYKRIISQVYQKRTGNPLNLDNPVRFTEKLQWRKIFDRDPVYSLLADKYRVRDWVKAKIGDDHLIPLLGVWKSFDEINFNELPVEFVLKTNNASGTNILVRDKRKLNMSIAKMRIETWLRFPYCFCGGGYEMPYQTIPPCIIAEKYMRFSDKKTEIPDYKFLCFNGEPKYCWVDINRHSDHRRNIYDMEWRLQDFRFNDYSNSDSAIEKPQNFDEMIRIVKILSEGFSHVRVDLYDIDEKVYFGEMTFIAEAGYCNFHPYQIDYHIGSFWDVKTTQADYSSIFKGCEQLIPQ